VYRTEQLVDLTTAPVATCQIQTSNAYQAGTADNVYLFFIGDFASSGPHQIGPFPANSGYNVDVTIQLDREIGAIKSYFFQKDGSDGWIMSVLACTLNGIQYSAGIASGEERFLDNFDTALAAENEGNGFEPDAQNTALITSPTMELQVTSAIQLFTSTGIARS
jgi:hypothetical protein